MIGQKTLRIATVSVLVACAWGCGDGGHSANASTNNSTNNSTNGSTNSSTNNSTNNSTNGSTNSSTNGSTNNTSNGWTFQPAAEICQTSAQDSTCLDGCTVEADFTIACADAKFGNPGIRVLATEDGAVVTTSSEHYAFAIDLVAGELEIDNELPPELVRNRLVSQLTADGRLAVVADATGYPSREDDRGLVLALRDGDAWTIEEIWNSGSHVKPLGYEWDAATDRAFVWFESDRPSGFSLATRAPDSSWTIDDVPDNGDGYGIHRFTMGADGIPVIFEHIETTNNVYQLRALAEGTTTDLGDPVQQSSGQFHFRVASSPARISDTAEPYVVLQPYDDGLHLITPGGADLTLPGSPVLGDDPYPEHCNQDDHDPEACDELQPCRVTYEGVRSEDYAVTRLDDDQVLVAYVYSNIDATVGDYAPGLVDDETAVCMPEVIQNDSTARLVVERADLTSGTTTRLLDISTLPGASDGLFYSSTEVRGVDIDTDGSNVAVTWRYGGELRLVHAVLQ